MDYYHIWCNLRDTSRDLEFCRALEAYLGHLAAQELIEGYRLARRKLGLGPDDLGEFHVTIEVRDMAQLERAFSGVAARRGTTESLHHAVYSAVRDVRIALYRDFPDAVRTANDDAASSS